MNTLKTILYLILNRFCKITGVSVLFFSRYGIKCINQTLSSNLFDSYDVEEERIMNASDLLIAFDGLKDDYSLQDLSIDQSPHADLMKTFLNNGNIVATDYVKRSKNGTLDLRYNQLVDLKGLHQKFKIKLIEVNESSYSPVKVSNIAGQYYIIDGKHTAALCSVLNKKVNCILVKSPFRESFYLNIFKRLKKRDKDFSRGIDFIEKIY